MTNQNYSFTDKLLPPYPEHRKESVIKLLEIMEGLNKAIETVEDHFPQQNSLFQKLTRQPPENWKNQTILTVKMTSDILVKTQNSLDRLLKIWPQGIVVTDYYQNFIDHFNGWLDVINEFANFEWDYFNQSESTRFGEMSAKNKKATALIENDISRFSNITKKIIQDLEPYGLREWDK